MLRSELYHCYSITTGGNVVISLDSTSLQDNQAAFIGLPPGLFNVIPTGITGLFFTFYSNASLFPFEDQTDRVNVTREVGSSVVGASIANESISGLTEDNRITVIMLLTDVRL